MFPLKDNLRCLTFPFVTAAIILLNIGAFIWESIQINSGAADNISSWLMVPAHVVAAFQSGDPHLMLTATMTIFASMFLHGGLLHIGGNMLFLWVFGRAVEARLGSWRYAGFYIVAGLLAAFSQIASNPASMVPTLGASGAIAGVLGGYLLLWPRADVTGFVPPLFLVRIRAYWFLIAWLIMQCLPIIQTGNDLAGAGVAYWEHVGGFAAGIAMAGIARLLQPVSEVCYIPSNCKPCDSKESEDKPQE